MKFILRLAVASVALLTSMAMAQTRYVSDELVITFRTGPSSQNAITKNLTSGTRLEVLEEQSGSGYSRVRLQDGSEGWVLTQYIQAEPTAALRLETATRQLADARGRVTELEQRLATIEADLAAARQTLSETESTSNSMSRELADIRSKSANAIETSEQNENLRRRVAQLTSEAEVANMEIDELHRRERQNWFIVGAAVLFGGIVIGLVAPSLRPKRRSSW